MSSPQPTPDKSFLKKRVRFNKDVYVSWHLQLGDYSEEERRQAWYSAIEIHEIKLLCAETIHRMSNKIATSTTTMSSWLFSVDGGDVTYSPQDDEDDFCTRGLEYRTKSGSRARQKNKVAAWDVVYMEQTRQWEKRINDPDALAKAYGACTEKCTKAAFLAAVEDEHNARHSGKSRCSECTKLKRESLQAQKVMRAASTTSRRRSPIGRPIRGVAA